MQLNGFETRRVLVAWLLEAERPLTVAQLTRLLEDAQLSVMGRPGEVISDCLRWEVRRGRVRRLGRGTYAIGPIPRSTEHRIRRQAIALLRGARPGVEPPDEVDLAAAAALTEFVNRRTA